MDEINITVSPNTTQIEATIESKGLKGDPGADGTDAVTTQIMAAYIHNEKPSEPRPTGYAQVFWTGSVEPLNAAESDLWLDTNNKLLKAKLSGTFQQV